MRHETYKEAAEYVFPLRAVQFPASEIESLAEMTLAKLKYKQC